MIVSWSRQFVFVHIHKTAGESVSAALSPSLQRGDLLIEDDPRTELRKRVLPNYRAARHLRKHSPARDVAAFVGPEWDELLRFAVVRDPASRIRSLYRYLRAVRDLTAASPLRRAWYRTPLGAAADPAKWAGMRALNETSTFSGFLRHPSLRMAPGMRPQVDMLADADGKLLVDRVLRVETLHEEFDDLRKAIGIAPSVALPRKNSSPHTERTSVALSGEDGEFLAAHFAADYAEFGYTPQT